MGSSRRSRTPCRPALAASSSLATPPGDRQSLARSCRSAATEAARTLFTFRPLVGITVTPAIPCCSGILATTLLTKCVSGRLLASGETKHIRTASRRPRTRHELYHPDCPSDTVGEVWSVWAGFGVGWVSCLEAAHVAPVAAAPVAARRHRPHRARRVPARQPACASEGQARGGVRAQVLRIPLPAPTSPASTPSSASPPTRRGAWPG